MKNLLVALLLGITLVLCFIQQALAAPQSPQLNFESNGLNLTVSWTTEVGATGYRLYYAPYPYTGPESISSIEMGEQTSFSITLWAGAAYYVAVTSYDGQEESAFSNIEQFYISSVNQSSGGVKRNADFLQSYLEKIGTGDKRPLYALYAGRLVAVPRPELYLQADRDFLDNIESISGSLSIYNRNIQDIMPGEPIETLGESFSLEHILLESYQTKRYRELLPPGYPFLPGFDERMLPLSAVLRANEVSFLEKATIAYFYLQKIRGFDPSKLFIIYSDQEHAWIWANGNLLDLNLNIVSPSVITEEVVLVFNEQYVWFPIMGRDDRASSGQLAQILQLVSAGNDGLINLAPLVDNLHVLVKNTYSRTSSTESRAFIRHISGHNDTNSRNYYPSVAQYLAQNPNRGALLPMFREEIRVHANILSPVSDYLSNFLKAEDWDGFESAFHSYNQWGGETWGTMLHVYTSDVGWRLNVGTCHDLSSFAAAASELANLSWSRIHGNDLNHLPDLIHFYVYLDSFNLVIDNGFVDDPGNNFYLTESPHSGNGTYSSIDIFLNRKGLSLFSFKKGPEGGAQVNSFWGSITKAELLTNLQTLSNASVTKPTFTLVDQDGYPTSGVQFNVGMQLLSVGNYYQATYP